MKTVSAKIISSKPISLSKAAKFLSNFVEYDNGASRAISTYLRCSSDAFNELSEFHKKLKSSSSGRKSNRSHASSGISTVPIELSELSVPSSEGEKAAEKRNEAAEIVVKGSKNVPRNSHGGDSESGFVGSLANGVEDNSEAVTEKKKREKKHTQKDRDDDDPAENGGKAREKDGEGISKTSVPKSLGEGVGDELLEKSSEAKSAKKKKKKNKMKGEEDDDSVLPDGEKEVPEGRYENKGLIEVDLPEESIEKKGKRKERGDEDEGHDSLPANGISTGEREMSEAKSGSEEGKKERKKKRKMEEATVSLELGNGSTEHRNKKAKKRMAD